VAISARSSDGVALTWNRRPLSRALRPRARQQFALERLVHHRKLEPSTMLVGIDTQNCGKLCAKLVVPSSGSTIHRHASLKSCATRSGLAGDGRQGCHK
jgi:hypothetical protein